MACGGQEKGEIREHFLWILKGVERARLLECGIEVVERQDQDACQVFEET